MCNNIHMCPLITFHAHSLTKGVPVQQGYTTLGLCALFYSRSDIINIRMHTVQVVEVLHMQGHVGYH